MPYDYTFDKTDVEKEMSKKRNRIVFKIMSVIAVAMIITFIGLALWLFCLVDAWFVAFLALISNMIQLVALRTTYNELKEMPRMAEYSIRIGYQPTNMEADDFVRGNRAYARAMNMTSVFGLITPWVFVLVVYLIGAV